MNRLTIGVNLESLEMALRRGLQEVERLGVTGIQVAAVGDLSPDRLSQTGRREFGHLLRAHNLELTALGCPLRHGLDTPQDLQERIDYVKKVLALSFELGPRIVIVQAGQIPEKPEDPSRALLTESLLALGHHGDRVGAALALETGLESGQVLASYLNQFDTGGLGVNFDPGNLLVHGFDVFASLRDLRGKVLHVHANDARAGRASRAAQELPLGQGDIDWLEFVSVLAEIDYRGWLTIEREGGTNRLADVASGVAFLRRLVG